MDYPQDVTSRRYLNSSGPPARFALAVVVGGRVVELQRWEGSQKIASDPGPPSRLLEFGTTPHRLVLYLKKNVWEWNPKTGDLLERAYEKGEQAPAPPFRAVPGEPQFRGQGDWCTVIIDGQVKLASPSKFYNGALERWNGLPAAKKTSLLGKPVLKAFGGHFVGAMRLMKYVAMAAAVLIPLVWVFWVRNI